VFTHPVNHIHETLSPKKWRTITSALNTHHDLANYPQS
jgi:hypothetical protein